jgi:hypothetical protein
MPLYLKGDDVMAQKKKQNPIETAKNQSMMDKNFNSLNSVTGYKDTGNDAQVHAKARAIRQSENGSHM